MSKKLIPLMFVSTALLLAGCTIGKKTSSASGSQSQGSESQPAVVAGDYKFDINAASLTADVETAATYTIGNAVEFSFPSGLMVNTKFSEFGFKDNYTLTMKALGGLKIKKIVFDNYKYYNDCPMYTGEQASGTSAVGVKGEVADNHLPVTWDNLDNAAYTYKNTYEGNSWTYGITVTIA